ncbi:tyrosine-type recombinase/integrase [Amycolatopsis sp. w19]|uniref:tyrosine-type recombinase/integrase n=1 Tax=Amycolatopsis sp. w19 TaxID=3448134 RepID=UPI003F1B13F4
MASKRGRRGFGNVRQRASGKWQARYPGPDGQMRNAPTTFASKRAAEQWLSVTETQIIKGEWIDPERAKVTLGNYADQWITQRPGLRPRTVELYRWLLRKHIEADLGGVELGKLSTAIVRQWRADRLAAGVSESVTAKAYRLLRAILTTAVDEDKILQRNPCRVRGADKENPAERPIVTVPQVFDLAGRMPERFRALVLLAAFASLRWGEVSALRRCDVAEDGSWVRISRALVEVPGRGLIVGPPKSRAGVRTLIVPAAIRRDVVKHLNAFVKPDHDALLFTGERAGNPVRRPNFSQRTKWTEVVAKMGLKGLHFHDLRHAGNIWASKAGTSTKDLMARMGHDDMRAALIYQRATSDADERIADRLSKLVDQHRKGGTDDDDDGLSGQPVPVG